MSTIGNLQHPLLIVDWQPINGALVFALLAAAVSWWQSVSAALRSCCS
jgi:hypothetical protein